MAPPNRPIPQPSSEEDTSSGSYSPSDVDEVDRHPPPLALTQHEYGGSDDGDEEESDEGMGTNGAPTKNLLLPPPQGTEVPDQVADSEDGSDEIGDSESHEVPSEPALPPKENAHLTEKPQQKKRKAPAAEVAESAQPKRMAPSAESPEMKSKVAEQGQAKSNVEKLFKEKCDSYWFLAEEVSALEAKHPGMFKVPFLKLADDMAHTLDAKIKNQTVAELKVHSRRGVIYKEVTNTLINLLK